MMPTVAAAAPTPMAYFAPRMKASIMSLTRFRPSADFISTPCAITAKAAAVKAKLTPGTRSNSVGAAIPIVSARARPAAAR